MNLYLTILLLGMMSLHTNIEAPVETPVSIEFVEETKLYLDIPLSIELQDFINGQAVEHDIPNDLIYAIIYQESRYDINAFNGVDYGLMQINEYNHDWLSETLGIDDFMDAEQNIRAGLHIFSYLYHKYDNVEMALMAYNMGEGGASKYWKQDIYRSNYSKGVMEQWEIIKKCLNKS